MKTDNELIAEFMGLEIREETAVLRKRFKWIDDIYYPTDSLKYNISWDWLMPVVEKIAEYRLAYPEETAKVCDCKIVIGLKHLYPKVVECIKFINQQSNG